MATIIEQQYALNSVVFDANYATGSIRDRSPNNATATVTAPAQWSNTKYGYGVRLYDVGYISYADNSSNRLTGSDATFVFFGKFCELQTSSRLICKRNAGGTSYDISCGILSSQKRWAIWDGTSTGIMNVPSFGESMIVFTLVSGQKAKIYIDGTYISEANVANTIPNSSAPLLVGNYYNTAAKTPLNSPLCRVLLLNKVLSAEEIAQLHTELVHQKYPLRAYSFGKRLSPIQDPPGCPSLLKTDFTTKLRDGRLADLSGNGWHGTIKPGFVAGPGIFGNSLVANSSTRSYVDFGDVTPINGASKLSIVWYGTFGSKSTVENIWSKGTGSTARNDLTANTTIQAWNLGNSQAVTVPDTAVNIPEFIAWTFDGSQLNADKVKAQIDNTIPTTTVVGTLPSTLLNSTGESLRVGQRSWSATTQPCAKNDFFAIYPYALTESQVSFIYKQIARRQTFELDMQKVPVTLANLVGPIDVPNTPFRLQSGGTWKISEDSNGKRWFESVSGNNTSVYMQTTQSTGTYIFDIYPASAGIWLFPIINSSNINDSARNGYGLYVTATNISFFKVTPSSGSAVLFSANSILTGSTKYSIAITVGSNRQYTVLIKGGSFDSWTIVPAVTSGTNPVIDTAYTTTKYVLGAAALAANAGKFSNPQFYQGVLTADDLNQMGL